MAARIPAAQGIDGVLRIGETVVTGFSNYDMVSRLPAEPGKPSGAALCFGDTGGPAYILDTSNKHQLLGVNCKGNVSDTNYDTRTDIPESQSFFKSFAQQTGADICGVNSDCSGPQPPPPPAAPSCTLTASPNTIKLGDSLTLALIATGSGTAATIEGDAATFPTGTKTITPTATGTFTAHATVTGKGGTGSCQTTYVVNNQPTPPPQPPTCVLSADPDYIKLGDSLTLELSTQGQVTSASIDATAVTVPLGKKIITPSAKGTFSSVAAVVGPGRM